VHNAGGPGAGLLDFAWVDGGRDGQSPAHYETGDCKQLGTIPESERPRRRQLVPAVTLASCRLAAALRSVRAQPSPAARERSCKGEPAGLRRRARPGP
jgi:hypothetical protein